MYKKIIAVGMLALLANSATPVFAESERTPAASEKISGRPQDLAKKEAPSQTPTSKTMKDDPGMKEKGMGANHSMGQMPQQNSDKSGVVKQPSESAPVGGQMSPAEMGKM